MSGEGWALVLVIVVAVTVLPAIILLARPQNTTTPTPEEQMRQGWASITLDHSSAKGTHMTTEELAACQDD